MTTAQVLCIIDTVGAGGGAEQLIASLLPVLRRRGVRVEVAALFDWPEDLGEQIAAAGVPVHRLHAPADRVTSASLHRLHRLIARRDYAVFWGHLLMGNLHARLAQAARRDTASVVTLHNQGHLASPPTRWKGKIGAAIEGRLLGGATLKVAVSHAAARDCGRYFGWDDIEIAHNGIDIDSHRTLAAAVPGEVVRDTYGIAWDDFLVACPARYIAAKGQATLIEAVAQLAGTIPVRLMLCGTGPMQDALAQLAAQAGIADRVTITGNLAQDRLLPLLAAADVIALPSMRESFGIAAAEAMAIGRPVILSRIDGFQELVGESGGALMVEPGSAAGFAAALSHLYAAPEAARLLGDRGAAHIQANFGIEACATRWSALLAQAAGEA